MITGRAVYKMRMAARIDTNRSSVANVVKFIPKVKIQNVGQLAATRYITYLKTKSYPTFLTKWEQIFYLSYEKGKPISHVAIQRLFDMFSITEAEIFVAVKSMKPGNAAACDENRPQILKSVNREGILRLTRVS